MYPLGIVMGLVTLYEDRPVGLWLLFSSYEFVVLTIAGVLFALWRCTCARNTVALCIVDASVH